MGEMRQVVRWVRCEDMRSNEMGEVRDIMRWVNYEM